MHATAVSRILECAVVIGYVRLRDQKIRLRLRHFGRMSRQLARVCEKKGVPVFLSSALWGNCHDDSAGILGRLGASAITANSIANTLFQIITVVTMPCRHNGRVMLSRPSARGQDPIWCGPMPEPSAVVYLVIGR